MAIPILVIGNSGAGKSTSLRNLNSDETIIIAPNAKDLPFRGSSKKYIEGKNLFRSNNLDSLQSTIMAISDSKPDVKYVVIEDLSHFFSARVFSPTFMSQNSGNAAFAKWNEFGASVFQALFAKAPEMRKDLFIIVLNHSELKDDGEIGSKSSGKLLDNAINLMGYFTWVFHAMVLQKDKGVEYVFQTNKDANRSAKTPMEAFSELYIPNDMEAIVKTIAEYSN